MNHAFFTGCKFNERTKFFNAYHFSFKNLTFIVISSYDLYKSLCFCHLICIFSTDRNISVISNVYLDICTLDKCIYCLSSLSDNITNLLRVNLHLNNLWCIFSYFFTRLRNSRFHTCIHDEKPCFTTSRNSTLYDRSCKSVNLYIHLDCSNSLCCTCNLEIHVSKEIFKPLNICEKYKIVICVAGNKTT